MHCLMVLIVVLSAIKDFSMDRLSKYMLQKNYLSWQSLSHIFFTKRKKLVPVMCAKGKADQCRLIRALVMMKTNYLRKKGS